MKKSHYKAAYSRLDRLKNRGFDYEGKIFERTISPYIFRDQKRREILQEFEKMIFFLIEKTKMIKTFFNYTVDKDYTKLN
jgi:hypothetical protein